MYITCEYIAIRISQLRRHERRSLREKDGDSAASVHEDMGMSVKWYKDAAVHDDVVLR
jgi:hypothetical protein